MKTTSISGKGDTREVAISVGMVLLWLRVLVVAPLLIRAAHAQTLVTQPTTTPWAGSHGTTLPLNFILGSVSTTPGTCSFTSNAITCNHLANKSQPGRKRTPDEIKKLGVELRR